MLDKALSAVEKYNMLSPGAAVIAAVSGGADSMAMLLFLMKISERYSLSLTVAHVNHGLRGEEARRDEEYVRSFCEKNSLRFEVLHADVAALAKQARPSLRGSSSAISKLYWETPRLPKSRCPPCPPAGYRPTQKPRITAMLHILHGKVTILSSMRRDAAAEP